MITAREANEYSRQGAQLLDTTGLLYSCGLQTMFWPSEHVMNWRKLERRRRNPQFLHYWPQVPTNEPLKRFLRLKNVDDLPTTLHGTRNMENPSRRGDPAGLQRLDDLVILVLGQARKLVQNCECH